MTKPLPREAPPFRRWLEACWVVSALALVVWFYTWMVATAGGLERPGEADYYNLLVRGYRQGHLYLDHAPAPEMLTLADPYDPVQNAPYRLPDATYFRGHYYLYFGVVPAVLVMWPWVAVTGTEMPTGAAVLVFCVLGFFAASGLWLAIRRRYFPASAAWTAGAGILILGLATHVLALARRPTIYELPIAAGYAFTMLALGGIYLALHGRRPVVALGAAGLCLGLAAASRPPGLFGAAMLLPVAWFAWREKKSWAKRGAIAAAVAIGACVLAMLAHNYARFGNALEFGQNYQLTSARELSNRHFGFDYMLHNVGVYYFLPVRWTWEFPFVAAHAPAFTISDYAGSEEMAGLLVTLPFLWLGLTVPLAWAGRDERERRTLLAILGAVAGLYVGVGGFLLTFFSTTERYLAEFAPALALLAVCGWLGVEQRISAWRWRVVVDLPVMTLVAVTLAMGVAVSFDYHGRSFGRDDPKTWARLERTAQHGLQRIGFALGQFDGPRVLKVRFVPRPVGTRETFWRATDARMDERIVIEHVSEREVRFGYARGAAPVEWGRRLTWESGHTHTVDLHLPSLYGAPRGFMRGLRIDEEFRERSSVAVWFSGGRALSAIAEPLPAEAVAGGAVGADFSGDVRGMSTRCLREDDLPEVVGTAADPKGGTLFLRVIFPTALRPEGEPLWASGALYGSDLVVVRPAAGGAVEFVVDHFNTPPLVSAPVRLVAGREYAVEIVLPNFAPGDAFSRAATGEVRVRLDGRDLIRSRGTSFPFAAGDEAIGRNPFGTGSGRTFRGWLREARWTGR